MGVLRRDNGGNVTLIVMRTAECGGVLTNVDGRKVGDWGEYCSRRSSQRGGNETFFIALRGADHIRRCREKRTVRGRGGEGEITVRSNV